MKTATFRLPDQLVAEIDAEARARHVTRSDVVRERLAVYGVQAPGARKAPTFRELAGDLIGSVPDDGRPADLAARKKHYLKAWGYGPKRHRG